MAYSKLGLERTSPQPLPTIHNLGGNTPEGVGWASIAVGIIRLTLEHGVMAYGTARRGAVSGICRIPCRFIASRIYNRSSHRRKISDAS